MERKPDIDDLIFGDERTVSQQAENGKNRTPRIGVLFLSFSGEEVTHAAPEGEIKGYSCTRFSLVQVVRPRRGYR